MNEDWLQTLPKDHADSGFTQMVLLRVEKKKQARMKVRKVVLVSISCTAVAMAAAWLILPAKRTTRQNVDQRLGTAGGNPGKSAEKNSRVDSALQHAWQTNLPVGTSSGGSIERFRASEQTAPRDDDAAEIAALRREVKDLREQLRKAKKREKILIGSDQGVDVVFDPEKAKSVSYREAASGVLRANPSWLKASEEI